MITPTNKTGQEKLEVQQALFAAIFNSSDNAILSKTTQGKITTWNRGAEKIFGYTSNEIIGQNISILIPHDLKKEEDELMKKLHRGEEISQYETERIRKDGKLICVTVTIAPILDSAGNIIGASKISRDITDKRKNEAEKENRAAELIIANKELAFQNEEKEKRAAELIIANKELVFQNEEKEKRAAELIIANKELAFQNDEKEKRAAELIVANKELVFQNEEKEKRAGELIIANVELEQFAYIASHDLQEPLRTVSNYMQVIEEDYADRLDYKAHTYIQSVNSAIERMSKLIKSLLDFSRLGRAKKLSFVNVKQLIADVVADLDGVIKTSHAVIDVSHMPQLNMYETEVRQVFQNLITNAIKFRKKGTRPKIEIRSQKEGDKWRFSIHDNGIGIAAENFDRVFDIFQRLRTDELYDGHGIGLANCKKIVHLHEGEIWIESTIGEGSTFNFTISNSLLCTEN